MWLFCFVCGKKKKSAAKSLKPKRFGVFDHSEMPVVCALSEILTKTDFIMEGKRWHNAADHHIQSVVNLFQRVKVQFSAKTYGMSPDSGQQSEEKFTSGPSKVPDVFAL